MVDRHLWDMLQIKGSSHMVSLRQADRVSMIEVHAFDNIRVTLGNKSVRSTIYVCNLCVVDWA